MRANFERFKKEIAIVAYCPPETEYESGGKFYPSKVNALQYDRMKELGINVVLGHDLEKNDALNMTFRAMELCAERDMVYLVRPAEFREYISLKKGKKYSDLSEEAKEDLKKRFLSGLKKFAGYESFGGVNFIDEPGAASFEGIRAAKDAFLSEYPDKIFYVNMFQYFISAKQYTSSDFQDYPANERYTAPDKETNYLRFMKDFINEVNPQFYSYDLYPMSVLHGVLTNIHMGFYELQSLVMNELKGKNIPFWNFIQCGGKWENTPAVRIPGFGECALMVNASLAMGATGIELFPYCLPDVWTEDEICDAGLIDANGDTTERYDYFRAIFRELKAAEKYLLSARYSGTALFGEFKGLMPSEEEIKKLPDEECFFRGKYNNQTVPESVYPVKKVETTSQLMLGVFDSETARTFYAVNNSITNCLNATVYLEKECKITVVRNGKKQCFVGSEIALDFMSEGEAALIKTEL